MTFIPNITGKISVNNSSTTLLNAGNVFTGIKEDISKYGKIEVLVSTDVNSSSGGLSVQFSSDGTNWDVKRVFTHNVESVDNVYVLKSISKFFRLVYTNGDTSQSSFRLSTRLHFNETDSKEAIPSTLIDSFGRLRVSNPFTL